MATSRSVETPLNELVETIEESLPDKEQTMVTFAYIEGTFKKLKASSIEKALMKFETEDFSNAMV